MNIRLDYDRKNNAVTVSVADTGAVYTQYPLYEGYSVSSVDVTDNKIELDLQCGASEMPVHCIYEVKDDSTVVLILDSSGALNGQVRYPQPFKPKPTDTLLFPYGEGVAFKANDPNALLPKQMALCGGAALCMGFDAVYGDGNWMLTAIMRTADGIRYNYREGELFRSDIAWIPEKGKWGYKRELRFIFGEGGITEICRAYRKIAEEKGFIVTLKEKAKTVPAVERLVGSADIWVWNDNAMDLLYSEGTPYSVPTKQQFDRRVEVALEMKSLGMDNVLWSIFNENFDRDTVKKIKDLGFLTTVYDIYTDVIPHPILELIPEARRRRCEKRLPLWPDCVMKLADGSVMKAWALKCTDGEFRDQDRICDRASIDLAKEVISERHEQFGTEGTFLDVTGVSARECYDEKHPMTRTSAFEHKRELMRIVAEQGEVCGTEIGCEDVVPTLHYDEGMMSPSLYRADDSGRRMTHRYLGNDIKSTITDYMLNYKYRVPLFELVYHDCVQSYWYWGDTQTCCPELTKLRDCFCLLYGVPPIYSFTVSQWESEKELILESYNRTVPNAKGVGFSAMESFSYLTDDMSVQRTEFSNGTTVTVNFGNNTYTDGEIVLSAGQVLISQNDKSYVID